MAAGLGLDRYAPAFRDQEIDAESLRELTEADLERMGLPIGPRRKLLKAIRELGEAPPPIESSVPAVPTVGEAERRQLTVMFCDLVGSTALSGDLDAEELGDVLRAYDDCVSRVVNRFEGHVAKFRAMGCLPTSDGPRRTRTTPSGRSAPRLTSSGCRQSWPRPDLTLQVQIGMATGPVVVGELIGWGRPSDRVGEKSNFGHAVAGIG